MTTEREEILELIRRNVRRYGYHVYVISGSRVPRFVYSIGLTDSLGTELLLAGGMFYSAAQARELVAAGQQHLQNNPAASALRVPGLGDFQLVDVHRSWVSALLLGATDYYSSQDIAALQILPSGPALTLDTPDMRTPLNVEQHPVWRGLLEPPEPGLTDAAVAVTTLDVLRGAPVTEACRWEEDQWELFSGPAAEVAEEDARVLPLYCMLGMDERLRAVLHLAVGAGLWRRDREDEWHEWSGGTGG